MLDTVRYRCDFGSFPPFTFPSAVFETKLQQAKTSSEVLLLSFCFIYYLFAASGQTLTAVSSEWAQTGSTVRKLRHFHFCIVIITLQE